MFYLNRKNISLVNRLRDAWGRDVTAQTNSRQNGHFGILRRYEFAEDKGRRRNFRGAVLEIRTERGLQTEAENL